MPEDTDPFRAIADPNRRRILDLIREDDAAVGELADHIGISQPAVSQHLGILKSAGLVTARKEGRHSFYRADAVRLSEVADWIAQYEAFWEDRLDRLGQHLARKRN